MSNPSLVNLFKKTLEISNRDKFNSIVATIESYNYKTRKASVKMQIKEEIENGTILSYPVISGVPVLMMGAGGARIALPVKRGDPCLLIFQSRDISDWLNSSLGSDTKARRLRANSLSDAVAIMGIRPFVEEDKTVTNGEDLFIYHGDAVIRMEKTGIFHLYSKKEINFDTIDMTARVEKSVIFNATNFTINVSADATINSKGNTFINAEGDINMKAAGNIDAKALTINLTADTINGVCNILDVKAIELVNIETTNGKINFKSSGDIDLEAAGNINFKCVDFNVIASNNFNAKSVNTNIESDKIKFTTQKIESTGDFKNAGDVRFEKTLLTLGATTLNNNLTVGGSTTAQTITAQNITAPNISGAVIMSGTRNLAIHEHMYISPTGPLPTTPIPGA